MIGRLDRLRGDGRSMSSEEIEARRLIFQGFLFFAEARGMYP